MTILLPLIMVIPYAPVFSEAKPVPFNQIESVLAIGGAALVALHPITNLVIAFIAFGIGVFSGA